jgi:parvulin-like peptidyl-prolyl isomerase
VVASIERGGIMSRKILFVGIISLFILSCAKEEEKVVARVGNKVITVKEFKKKFSPRTGVNVDSLKRATIDKMIDDKLLVIDAINEGMYKNIRNRLDNLRNRLIVTDLYNTVVTKRVKVPVWKVKDYWYKLDTEVKARHILLNAKDEAERVYEETKQAKDFAALARLRSQDRRTSNKGGDLGWVKWGTMVPEFQEVAFSLKKGEISEPVRTAYGYHIIKVEDIKKVERPSFDKEKVQIESKLRGQEESMLANKYLEHLKALAKIRYNEEVIKKLAKETPTSAQRMPNLPSCTPEEREEIVASSAVEGELTVGELLDKARGDPRRAGSFADPQSIKEFIANDLVYNVMLSLEASRYGLDKLPNVLERLRESEENFLLTEYRRIKIQGGVSITDDELKDYYNEHKEKYVQKAKAKARIITAKTEKEAADIKKRIIRGADFEKLAKELSTHRSKTRGGDLGWFTKESRPVLGEAAFDLRKGEISPPFVFEDGYAIIKLEDKQPQEIANFKEVEVRVNRDLSQEKQNEIERNILNQLRKDIRYEINEDVLKAIN